MLDKYNLDQLLSILKASADSPADYHKYFTELLLELFKKTIETIPTSEMDLVKKEFAEVKKHTTFYRNYLSQVIQNAKKQLHEEVHNWIKLSDITISDFAEELVKMKEEIMKLSTKARNKLPKKEFALPKERKYPVEDKAHARAAKSRASQMVKKGKLSASSKAKIDARANKVLKKGKGKKKD